MVKEIPVIYCWFCNELCWESNKTRSLNSIDLSTLVGFPANIDFISHIWDSLLLDRPSSCSSYADFLPLWGITPSHNVCAPWSRTARREMASHCQGIRQQFIRFWREDRHISLSTDIKLIIKSQRQRSNHTYFFTDSTWSRALLVLFLPDSLHIVGHLMWTTKHLTLLVLKPWKKYQGKFSTQRTTSWSWYWVIRVTRSSPQPTVNMGD